MTFADLVARFKEKRLIDPVFIGERKVAGYKHKDKLESRIDRLAEYFGEQLLSQITLAQIEDYKLYLIKTPTRFEKQRSVYDVNHQLRTLRLLLNFAKKSRWLKESPMRVPDEPSARIFGPAASNRKAFATACRKAGIKNLQRKDLRKWATTRYVAGARRAGIPENQVMTMTGHTKFETFRWYLLTDRETVRSLGEALDTNREKNKKENSREN